MNTPGCSFYDDVQDVQDDEPLSQPDPEQKAMSNYRWSQGLINPKTFGMTIKSMEQLRSDCNLTKIVKLATKNGTRIVLSEFERWTKSFKIQTNSVTTNMINKRIKRCLRSVKVAVEKEEFAKIEEDIKTYWKLTIAWARDRFMLSDEEYLVRWFGGDLKLRTEWVIRHGSMPKFTNEQVNKRFEHFIKPLRILQRYGYRKQRIYLQCGTRAIKAILGPELCESPEEAMIRTKSYTLEKIMRKECNAINTKIERDELGAKIELERDELGVDLPTQETSPDGAGNANEAQGTNVSMQEAPKNVKQLTRTQRKRRKQKQKKKVKNLQEFKDKLNLRQEKGQKSSATSTPMCMDPLASSEEQFQKKIDFSEGHPLLLTALSDFKNVTSNPEAYNVKTKDVIAESVDFKRPGGTGSSAVDAFVVGFEATFDLNQILDSVCDFSDDFSYSSGIFERHLRGGSGLKKLLRVAGQDCPYFLDLCDPETFAVFQSEFVDTAAKFYAQRNAPSQTVEGKK